MFISFQPRAATFGFCFARLSTRRLVCLGEGEQMPAVRDRGGCVTPCAETDLR